YVCAPCSLLFYSRPSPPPISTFFPYTTLFRSCSSIRRHGFPAGRPMDSRSSFSGKSPSRPTPRASTAPRSARSATSNTRWLSKRSEEHTSELQSPDHLVCRLLLEKKKKKQHKQ